MIGALFAWETFCGDVFSTRRCAIRCLLTLYRKFREREKERRVVCDTSLWNAAFEQGICCLQFLTEKWAVKQHLPVKGCRNFQIGNNDRKWETNLPGYAHVSSYLIAHRKCVNSGMTHSFCFLHYSICIWQRIARRCITHYFLSHSARNVKKQQFIQIISPFQHAIVSNYHNLYREWVTNERAMICLSQTALLFRRHQEIYIYRIVLLYITLSRQKCRLY